MQCFLLCSVDNMFHKYVYKMMTLVVKIKAIKMHTRHGYFDEMDKTVVVYLNTSLLDTFMRVTNITFQK